MVYLSIKDDHHNVLILLYVLILYYINLDSMIIKKVLVELMVVDLEHYTGYHFMQYFSWPQPNKYDLKIKKCHAFTSVAHKPL